VTGKQWRLKSMPQDCRGVKNQEITASELVAGVKPAKNTGKNAKSTLSEGSQSFAFLNMRWVGFWWDGWRQKVSLPMFYPWYNLVHEVLYACSELFGDASSRKQPEKDCIPMITQYYTCFCAIPPNSIEILFCHFEISRKHEVPLKFIDMSKNTHGALYSTIEVARRNLGWGKDATETGGKGGNGQLFFQQPGWHGGHGLANGSGIRHGPNL